MLPGCRLRSPPPSADHGRTSHARPHPSLPARASSLRVPRTEIRMMRSKDEYQRTVAGVWSDLQNLPSRWEQYGAADTEPTESPIWVTARSARNTEDGSGVVPRRSIDLPQFADR